MKSIKISAITFALIAAATPQTYGMPKNQQQYLIIKQQRDEAEQKLALDPLFLPAFKNFFKKSSGKSWNPTAKEDLKEYAEWLKRAKNILLAQYPTLNHVLEYAHRFCTTDEKLSDLLQASDGLIAISKNGIFKISHFQPKSSDAYDIVFGLHYWKNFRKYAPDFNSWRLSDGERSFFQHSLQSTSPRLKWWATLILALDSFFCHEQKGIKQFSQPVSVFIGETKEHMLNGSEKLGLTKEIFALFFSQYEAMADAVILHYKKKDDKTSTQQPIDPVQANKELHKKMRKLHEQAMQDKATILKRLDDEIAKVMPEQTQSRSTSNTDMATKNVLQQPTEAIKEIATQETEPNDSFCKTLPNGTLPYSGILPRVALWNSDPEHAIATIQARQQIDLGCYPPNHFYATCKKLYAFSSDVDYFIEPLAIIREEKDGAVSYKIPGQIIDHGDLEKTDTNHTETFWRIVNRYGQIINRKNTDTIRTGMFSYLVNRYGNLTKRCFEECSYNDMAKQSNTSLNPEAINKKDSVKLQPTQALGTYQENNWYIKIKDAANNSSLVLFKLKRQR